MGSFVQISKCLHELTHAMPTLTMCLHSAAFLWRVAPQLTPFLHTDSVLLHSTLVLLLPPATPVQEKAETFVQGPSAVRRFPSTLQAAAQLVSATPPSTLLGSLSLSLPLFLFLTPGVTVTVQE